MKDKTHVFREVQKALSKGQIDRAIQLWEEYVAENPDGNIFNTIGDLYLRKGQSEKAIEFFHRAAEKFKEDGFFTKAQAIYKKILNINPAEAKALISTGDLYKERGLINEAVKFYLGAIDSYAKEGKNKELSEVCEKIIGIVPENLSLRIKLANYLHKEGFLEEASREYLNIGRLYKEKGEINSAKEYFEKSIEIYPRFEETYNELYRFYMQHEMYEEAESLLEKALELFPENPSFKVRLSELLFKLGKTEDAKDLINEALSSEEFIEDTVHDRLLELLSDIYLQENSKELALQSVNKLVDRKLLHNRVEEAIRLLEKYRDLSPEEFTERLIQLYTEQDNYNKLAEELIKLGDIKRDKGDTEEALKLYQSALQYRPDDESLITKIAELTPEEELAEEPETEEPETKSLEEKLIDVDIFLRYGLTEEAIDLLEKLKVESPESIEVHKRLKDLYIEINDKERAIAECLALSKLYERAGDLQQKEQALREAFEIDPTDPRLIELSKATEEFISKDKEEEFIGTELKGFETEEEVSSPEVEPSPTTTEYSEALSEAEFYYRQGLLKNALEIYERLFEKKPDDIFLKERIDAIRKSLGEELSVEQQETQETISTESTETLFEPEEIKAVVEDDTASPEPLLDSEVMEIFEEFKKGIADEIEEEDYETHYNLGIAYKEMGLIDDAIKEFQIARHDPNRKVQVLSILGLCYIEKGLYSLAIDTLKEALNSLESKDESYWSIKYDLAEAYEKSGDLKRALDIYVEIYGWNSKFRGVDEKVNTLKAMLEAEIEEAKDKNDQQPPPPKKNRISYI